MESGEHMPDKNKFVNELVRVAAPGGTIILVAWCHRDLKPSEGSLSPEEKNLLDRICKVYYLPEWCSTADYVKLLQSLSLEDIRSADWSEYVAPFWPAVIRSALTWKGIISLLKSGNLDFSETLRRRPGLDYRLKDERGNHRERDNRANGNERFDRSENSQSGDFPSTNDGSSGDNLDELMFESFAGHWISVGPFPSDMHPPVLMPVPGAVH